MKKKFPYFQIFFLIAMLFSMAGCKNRRDIEDSSYVLAMGFEKINAKRYLVHYSYADFDSGKSNEGIKIPSRTLTFVADSFMDANKIWDDYESKQLNFGHLKVVVFGNGKKDPKIVKELLSHPQIAKSVYLLETEKVLSKVFEKEEKLSISFGEYMAQAIENSGKIKDPKKYTLGRIMY